MSKIPFEEYFVDPVERIKLDRAQGVAVSGDALLHAIEWSLGHRLDDSLRGEVSNFSISADLRPGRPPNDYHLVSVALGEVNARYPALLQKYAEDAKQRRSAAGSGVLAKAEPTPSELAYTEILSLKPIKAAFPNMGWQALRNKHSIWKAAITDSDDFDADIEARLLSRLES